MGQFSSFDELPLIVHDGILHSLSSPRDVANTIRASPGSLQAYMTGRRSVVLLSALRNSLSLENQHLMKLVMAAPHYYKHGEIDNTITPSTRVDFDGVSRDDFDRTVHHFLNSFRLSESYRKRTLNMRELSLNTIDCSIRLYAIMDKAIRSYCLFTLARAQRRVHKLSDPRTFRSNLQFTDCGPPAPNSKESHRVWRGFLLYELFCIMYGISQVTAPLAEQRQYPRLNDIKRSFEEMPAYVREEFVCVQRYVLEQYALAFNMAVESFGLAVDEMGRRTTGGTLPNIELKHGDLPSPLGYLLFETDCDSNGWTIQVAMLGVSFLQEFLSWDSTTWLNFIRTTYWFLRGNTRCPFRYVLRPNLGLREMMDKNFGWSRYYFPINFVEIQLRLRAVGWIFWEDPERLASLNLVRGLVDSNYVSKDGILPYIKLTVRSFLTERLPDPEDWEHIVRDFGTPKGQRNDIKSLFNPIRNLNPGRIGDIISASRHQGVEASPTEAKDNSG